MLNEPCWAMFFSVFVGLGKYTNPPAREFDWQVERTRCDYNGPFGWVVVDFVLAGGLSCCDCRWPFGPSCSRFYACRWIELLRL